MSPEEGAPRPSGKYWRATVQSLLGCAGVALITFVSFQFQRQALTPMCLYLILIVFLSLRASFLSSTIVSIVAIACLDYFFVPPLFSFRVSDESDTVAFITFLISAAVITRLVSRVGVLMKEKLKQTEAYLSEAQQLSHTGSFGWKVATGEIFWSEQTFRIFQLDRTDKPTIEFVLERTHPDDAPFVRETIERAAREGSDFDFEHRLLMPDRSIRHLRVAAHLNKNKAGEFEFIGSVMDITESKRVEEALRQARTELAHVSRLTTMGELTASIAHEVNQPLTGIVMNGNAGLRWLAGESRNLEEARLALERIVRDGKRAGDVIARIRALVKKVETFKESLNIDEVIREVIGLMRVELQRNGVVLDLRLTGGLPAVRGDRVQLQPVMMNLILNAIEAMNTVEDRTRKLVIHSRAVGDDEVSVEVEDSGIGIDPSGADRIFDALHTTKPEGLGMGLSISRSIIENHGGRLQAVTKSGPGAVFQFTLAPHDRSAEDA